jgi:predicted dehydrogenase
LNSKLKIGLVGCGRAAELIYLPAIIKFPDIEVNGVIDPVIERRELIASKFNNCYNSNYLDSNFIERIDAAIVSTPPDSHVAVSSELLKNNKYVLVEKPLALSMEGIKGLTEITKASQASLMMGFNHRNWQPVINLKNKLSQKIKVNSAEIIFIGNYSSWNPVSFKGEPLNDLGPHVFDLVRFLFNEKIISISARFLGKNDIGLTLKIPEDILINCRIAHSNKTVKSLIVNSEEDNFYVKLGSIRINPEPGNFRKLLDLKDTALRKFLRKTSPIKNSYDVQLNNFINFIKSNGTAVPGIEDGIKALIAAEAAGISLNNKGKEIYLDEIKY